MVFKDLSQAQKAVLKTAMLTCYNNFVRGIFSCHRNMHFQPNWHFSVLDEILLRIWRGQSTREILNMPPGSGKSDYGAILGIIYMIVLASEYGTGSTRWFYTSYSQDLCEKQGAEGRDALASVWAKELFGIEETPSAAKTEWMFRDRHGNRHEFYATTLLGKATGQRAGFLGHGHFSGMLVIDDPMPPKDIFSNKKMMTYNNTITSVLRSRLADDTIPILLIQQRVAPTDTTDFLLKKKELYNLTKIPALITKANILKSVPEEYRKEFIAKIEKSTEGAVSYWELKEPTESLLIRKEDDGFTFAAQYQQEPDPFPVEGVIFAKEIEKMERDGRTCFIPVEPNLKTYTTWDLGRNDHMAIYVIQTLGQEVRFIKCFADRMRPMQHYIKAVLEWGRENEIMWEAHVMPHDVAVTDLTNAEGKSRKQVAEDAGLKPIITIPRVQDKMHSIESLRRLFPRIWMDDEALGRGENERVGKGYLALSYYHREYSVLHQRFNDMPVHNWASNYLDAAQQFAMYDETVKRTASKDVNFGLQLNRLYGGGLNPGSGLG